MTVAVKIKELKSSISLKFSERHIILVIFHSTIMIFLFLIISKNKYAEVVAKIVHRWAVVLKFKI